MAQRSFPQMPQTTQNSLTPNPSPEERGDRMISFSALSAGYHAKRNTQICFALGKKLSS